MQKPRRIGELRDALLEKYHVESDRCERDLLEFGVGLVYRIGEK